MRADPIAIELAWEGYSEELEDYERMIYGAQGHKLPPTAREQAATASTTAANWKAQFREHNIRFALMQDAKRKLSKRGARDKKPDAG